jgi:hypothetical protein
MRHTEETSHPTEDLLTGCETAYAKCEGFINGNTSHPISTCFLDDFDSAWGWNIDLVNEPLTTEKRCNIYAGAAHCDHLGSGTLVGELIMTSKSVSWQFMPGYGSSEFHLHIGDCPANDNGEVLDSGECSQKHMEMWARTPGKYTLTVDRLDNLNTFYFDEDNYPDYLSSSWTGYDPFDIGSSGYRYISAHAHVCPCPAGGCGHHTRAPSQGPSSTVRT